MESKMRRLWSTGLTGLLLAVFWLVLSPAYATLLFVSDLTNNKIRAYDADTGKLVYTMGASQDGINDPYGMAIGPDGLLYVASHANNRILRYNPVSGAFVDNFAAINGPRDVLFNAQGNMLVGLPTQVNRYDSSAGTFSPLLGSPLPSDSWDIEIGPDGRLYVSDASKKDIKLYDANTGAFIQTIVPAGSGGLSRVYGFTFGPDGNLYVSDYDNDRILRYNGQTGAFINVFASGGGLNEPLRLHFGPNGSLYVISHGNNKVLTYQGPSGAAPGQFIRELISRVTDSGLGVPYYLIFPESHVRGDINGDFRPDLIWQNQNTGDVTSWFMNGTAWQGAFGTLSTGIGTAWKVVGVADLNSDGKSDLIWWNQNTGDVTYWLMNGTQTLVTGFIAKGIPTAWRIVAVADLNSDGKPDLLWQNQTTGDVTYWVMNGTQYTNNWGYIVQNLPDWKLASAVDLNGDGQPDMVWQNQKTGDVTYWLMNGTVWTGNWDYIAHSVPTDWKIVATIDLTGDNSADLVWHNLKTGDVTYWEMDRTRWTTRWNYIAQGVPTQWRIAGPR